MRRSRELSASRLPSMSKIPPHFRESLRARRQRPTALSNSVCHSLSLKDSLACAKHFVQRFLKMRGCARKVSAHLRNVFLVALLDLVSEKLLQRSLLQTFRMLRWIIRNHVGNESARKAFRSQAWIAREERIDWATLTRRRLTLCCCR